jgi:hypothetical protein
MAWWETPAVLLRNGHEAIRWLSIRLAAGRGFVPEKPGRGWGLALRGHASVQSGNGNQRTGRSWTRLPIP